MIDYNQYEFTKLEIALYAGEWLVICSVIGWLFYHSIIAIIIMFLFIKMFFQDKKKLLNSKRKNELNVQFRDAISSLSSALSAGYSIENAFAEAYDDLLLVYSKEALIIKELYYIVRKLEMNETIETLLEDLSRRSGDEDIKSFTEVFTIAKRSGGDFISIIDMTTNSISGKIDVKREIKVILSDKKLEQRIMNMIPIMIILYVGSTSQGFFDSLYNNLFGIIIMTICLGIYGLAYLLGRKIVEVEV
ncbi:MAG: type II secretion system F family protein [Lachnotalea sp.]